jgi:NAD(P)-dependent dehydrogenase (short-subunit alcohol dehydrogenase family)
LRKAHGWSWQRGTKGGWRRFSGASNRESGTIAFVTSGAGRLPMPGYLGYSTSKHAMNGFFETLRLGLSPHGVDVLAVDPGEMYSDDGAGRTVLGPKLRPLAPAVVDRKIYERTAKMRSAFASS